MNRREIFAELNQLRVKADNVRAMAANARDPGFAHQATTEAILHLADTIRIGMGIFSEPFDDIDAAHDEEITAPPFALALDLEAVAETHANDISNLAERVSRTEDRLDANQLGKTDLQQLRELANRTAWAVRTIQDTIDSPVPLHRLQTPPFVYDTVPAVGTVTTHRPTPRDLERAADEASFVQTYDRNADDVPF